MKIAPRHLAAPAADAVAPKASAPPAAAPPKLEPFAGYPPVPYTALTLDPDPTPASLNEYNIRATFDLARRRPAQPAALATEHPVTEDNRVLVLFDGARVFPRIFEDLRRAETVINISTFALTDDRVGGELISILEAKARAGVEVNVIADALGSRLALLPNQDVQTLEAVRRLRAAGARVHVNRVLDVDRGIGDVEHRKIVTIDGRIAYTGGMGFQEIYEVWHDCMLRYEGAVVQQVQIDFLKSWLRLGFELVPAGGSDDDWTGRYFPRQRHEPGGVRAKVSSQIPGVASQAKQAYVRELRALEAGDAMWIANPYVVDETLLREMVAAAERGAQIKLIVPGVNDHAAVQFASRSQYDRLLAAGVRVFEWPGMVHMKVAASSRGWWANGSFNFDALSASYMRDMIVESEAPRGASELAVLLEADAQKAREIAPGEFAGLQKLAGALARQLLSAGT